VSLKLSGKCPPYSGQYLDALEKAKEVTNREKNLRKQRENSNTADLINVELSFAVALNHALCLEAGGMFQEALTKYNDIIKRKEYSFAGRIRVNMGNIYYHQQKFAAAIKMYKMALDILPSTSKEMRYKVSRNIGHAYVKLGQYQDAISHYEQILKGSPDHKTAYNLIVCLYTTGDKMRMKDCFTSMITNPLEEEDAEEEDQDNPLNDKLKEEGKARRKDEIRLIISSAKLIAPVIENDVIESYDWILEKLKTSSYPEVESEVEIFKAMAFLKKKEIERAIETLKGLEKKDKTTMSRVASNISFLYFLEKNYSEAERYVDIALSNDRYNARALVNKGNCLFMKNDFRKAKELYLEAIGVEADCIEALYNLGYVNKKLNLFIEALQVLPPQPRPLKRYRP
jgi:intraflagellar transport protein 88